jgi:hypothetical protein
VSNEHPTPYVPVEIIGGRLVRLCPACRQQIVERTDDDGIVSLNFDEHYETEHGEKEPERQRGYLLALQPRDGGKPGPSPEALRGTSQMILEMVKRQIPELDWQIVYRLEDLPEGAPALEASQVLRGSWQREGDDAQLRQVRWYRREQDSLVFTPTMAQFDEWDAARDRSRDARAALIERHRDHLPVFAGTSLEDWDEYSVDCKRQEDKIAKDFDTECEAATRQFYRGDYRWLATLSAAITTLGIPEDEVEELRYRTEARIAEAEASLRIHQSVQSE